MNDVPLSRLTHDIVQNTYKELHALLDSMGDLPQEDRPEKLMDFVLKVRHRFARLLVALRWFMSYSAFHSSAKACRQIALTRCLAFTNSADTLFAIPSVVRGAAAHPSAVQEAAEVLGASAFFGRIPRVIETAIGLDKSANINDLDSSDSEAGNADNDITNEAIERLGSSTRYVVRSSLPKGVVVINVTAPPNDAAIRIGVPNVWTADLILDRLKIDTALLILLRFTFHVGPHPDAVGPTQKSRESSNQPIMLPREQSEPLRQMIEGRMCLVTNRCDQEGDKENRIKNAMLSLSKAMSFECAGRMAMYYVRAQAAALLHDRSWRATKMSLSGVGSEAADHIPVQIRYWPMSYMQATLCISLAKEKELHESETNVLNVAHDPELPDRGASVEVCLQSVDIESVLLRACRIRADAELCSLQRFCESQFPEISAKIVCPGKSSSILILSFDGETHGLGIGLSYRSGGYFVRSYGAVSLALSRADSFAEELQLDLWHGMRYFTMGLDAVQSVLSDLIKKTARVLSIYVAVQSCYGIDAGVIPYWPPGPSFVEKPETTNAGKKKIKPPLVNVDRSGPRRFMTLSSTANVHDEVHCRHGISQFEKVRSLPMQVSSSSDGLGFIEGRRPEGIASHVGKEQRRSTAVLMTEWAEMRHAADLRIKRDTILRLLESSKLAYAKESDFALKSTDCSLLNVKTLPMEIEKGVLLLLGNGGWKVQLTLTNNIFDCEDRVGHVVTYFPETRLLSFSYPAVSTANVVSFGWDLRRTRTAAALIQGISSTSKHYSILRKTPLYVELDLKPYSLRMTVGLGKKEIEIEVHPAIPLLRDQLVPLMEELLQASGRKMGVVLNGLLELAIPFASALVRSVPSDPRFKLRFSTALHIRVSFSRNPGNPGERTFGVDVDARGGRENVLVIDISRLAKIRGGRKSLSSHYSDIPFWDSLLREVTEKKYGTGEYDGSALNINISLLANILKAVFRSFIPPGSGSSSK